MRRLLIIAAAAALAACGGGGGGSTAPTPAPVAAATPIKPFPTSYLNAKGYRLAEIQFPTSLDTVIPISPAAWGASDFFQNGNIDIFTAKQNYNPDPRFPYSLVNGVPQYQSDFQFWHRDAATGILTASGSSMKGCLHPRKALVADFLNNGNPGVFVACTGYDAYVPGVPAVNPYQDYPGETNKLVLSDGKGGFTVTDVPGVGYFHAAAVADVYGDGYPDIVVGDMNNHVINVYFLINNKDGTFTKDSTRITGLLPTGAYYGLELMDVDGDGVMDLVVGGVEPNGQSIVLYGQLSGGNITFGSRQTPIPAVKYREWALDFTLGKNTVGQTIMYIDRTSDVNDPTSCFYCAETVQVYNFATNASSVPLDIPNSSTGSIFWWLPTTRNGQNGIVPNNAQYPDLFVTP